MQRLRAYNYFAKIMSKSTEKEIKQQLVSTRLFFILLLVSFVILISYYAVERITTLHQIESPTIEQFINLKNDYRFNQSLSCPCSTLAISHKSLVQVNYTLHPLCSSDFVQQYWLSYSTGRHSYHLFDFRWVAPSIFYFLASYCQVVARHIDTSLISFSELLFIADQALAPETFVEEINAIFNTYKSSTTRTFTRQLAVNSDTTRSNELVSGLQTNFVFRSMYWSSVYVFVTEHTRHMIPSGNTEIPCDCLLAKHCSYPTAIYSSNITSITRLLDIPGLFVDCLMDEGIRSSNLACLFNQSCVDLMSFWLNMSNVSAIDNASLIHFYPNSTVDAIVNDLFVDQWNYSASYRAFYQRCKPALCTYTLVEHNHFWFILCTVFGLIGGLMKILQITVPRLVQAIYSLYSRCRRCWHPEIVPPVVPSNFSFDSFSIGCVNSISFRPAILLQMTNVKSEVRLFPLVCTWHFFFSRS